MVGRLALLNTSILTSYGSFEYQEVTQEFIAPIVCEKAARNELDSYVGHEATAAILSTLFGVEVPVNRAPYHQEVDDVAVVFKLRQRIDVPRELTVEEIEAIGYDLGAIWRKS